MFEFRSRPPRALARAGTLTLPHGTVPTPAFMPVGTHGVVRGLSADDVARTGAQIILGNTYHLHLRPGEASSSDMGGLNRFTTWSRPMLTDSGGFQVFSLEGLRRIGEDGVEFQSHVDGTYRKLTPERAMEIQWALGADIAMAFDHVVPGQAPHELACEGMERTLRWLERCKERHEELADRAADGGTGGTASGRSATIGPDRPSALPPVRQTLWPILQGGTHDDLRLPLARGHARARAVDRHRHRRALGRRAQAGDAPRAGDARAGPAARDAPLSYGCRLSRRSARGDRSRAWTCSTASPPRGTAGTAPRGCRPGGSTCAAPRSRARPSRSTPSATARPAPPIPRGYLRHLFVVEDMLGLRLVSLHNIRFLVRLGEQARAHILAGTFDGWSREWLRRHYARGT